MAVNIMDIDIGNIIRTKRKTIALQMADDATLVVRAPLDADDETIRKVVHKHRKWIEKKRKEIASGVTVYSPREFVNGEGFLYLGKYYKLSIVPEQEEPLRFDNGFYLSKEALPRAKELFIGWYRKAAYEKISERVKWYAQKRGISYNKVNITGAMNRWGSCTQKRNLNFSWRLIMAPLPVIDYVVVHELVHLVEKNHSKSFWIKVKLMIPDYKKHSEWLKKNGNLMRL